LTVPDFSEAFEVDGRTVRIRPIQPEDREREAAFVRGLSRESRYFRFHSAMRELTPAMLQQFTRVDYPDDLALVALTEGAAGDEQIGVARYSRVPGTDTAEIAIVVADAWQGKGIGTRLLTALQRLAREGGIERLIASVLRENGRMLALARARGFELERGADDPGTRRLGKDTGARGSGAGDP
jgi:acetyltransferase